jgi:hypothetical protein
VVEVVEMEEENLSSGLLGRVTFTLQGSGRITVQVKTPKEKQAVEVEGTASIKQVTAKCM